MKKFLAIIFVVLFGAVAVSAQKKVSVLGDSYSTFKGTMPKHYDVFYPVPPCKVTEMSQMWWQQFIDSNGYVLEKNDSWSGSTICNSGYNNEDYSDRSFYSRVNMLGNPDIIFIFGGTNDDWAKAPLGEYMYKDWTKQDLYSFRPAVAYMLAQLKTLYPKAEIYFLMNSDMRDDIDESIIHICKEYGVPFIELRDIEKAINHPTDKGMTAISNQINEFIANQK